MMADYGEIYTDDQIKDIERRKRVKLQHKSTITY